MYAFTCDAFMYNAFIMYEIFMCDILTYNAFTYDILMKFLFRRPRKSESMRQIPVTSGTATSQRKSQQHGQRVNEQVLMDKCPDCRTVLEQFDDEVIGLCVVAMATFIHREPTLAAPHLLEIIYSTARYIFVYIKDSGSRK